MPGDSATAKRPMSGERPVARLNCGELNDVVRSRPSELLLWMLLFIWRRWGEGEEYSSPVSSTEPRRQPMRCAESPKSRSDTCRVEVL